jgi:hypothetical protein
VGVAFGGGMAGVDPITAFGGHAMCASSDWRGMKRGAGASEFGADVRDAGLQFADRLAEVIALD